MPISFHHKILFIHIPKTGGQSFERLLQIPMKKENFFTTITEYHSGTAPAQQHLHYQQLKSLVSPEVWKFEKIAFTRNPWDRLLSTYFWHNRGFETFDQLVHFIDQLFHDYTPETIVQYPQYAKHFCAHFVPQSLFVGPDVQVFRFENYRDEVEKIKSRLGIKGEIPHDHQTSHQHYSHYYTDETKAIVERLYFEDIQQFGYSFEDCRPKTQKIVNLRNLVNSGSSSFESGSSIESSDSSSESR